MKMPLIGIQLCGAFLATQSIGGMCLDPLLLFLPVLLVFWGKTEYFSKFPDMGEVIYSVVGYRRDYCISISAICAFIYLCCSGQQINTWNNTPRKPRSVWCCATYQCEGSAGVGKSKGWDEVQQGGEERAASAYHQHLVLHHAHLPTPCQYRQPLHEVLRREEE